MTGQNRNSTTDRIDISVHGAVLPSDESGHDLIAAGLGDAIEHVLDGYEVECDEVEVTLSQDRNQP